MLQLLYGFLLLAGLSDQPYLTWVSEVAKGTELPETVGQKLSANDLARLADSKPVLPYSDLTCGVRLDDGAVWVGAKQGLMYRTSQMPRWRLFHTRRWLPADQIDDLAVDKTGTVWVKTSGGLAKLSRRETTLDQKMAQIEEQLRQQHVRLGLVGAIELVNPHNPAEGWWQPSSDNDGLWTSLYVAAEAFRFGATGDPTAKANAAESLRALLLLEQITGIPGFCARSFYPADVPFKPGERHGGEWHLSKDGKWWWKGDTSSDELDGHYFAYAVYYDIAATEEEKKQIRGVVARITDHILDHGYYYVGPSGQPTTWGVWAPERLNHDLSWFDDRGLNSLEILSHLKVAEHVTGDPKYARAAKELIDKHAYAINTVLQKLLFPAEAVNHSDDELAFLAYYPLLRYERDPQLRKIYLASLERSWQIERPEQSPFFNFIYAACRQAGMMSDPSQRPEKPYLDPAEYDRDACVEWFREVPADLYEWTVKNSDRNDLGQILTNRFQQKRSTFVLPIAERRVMRWNGDPYELDGGADGRARDDGTFILLPYWMGRYHRFID
jgi:hypothetical protein